MGLFSASVKAQIDQVAAKSTEQLKQADGINSRSMNDELNNMSKQVIEYFKDSRAILITTKDQLHEYVDKCIEFGYAGIDTETTGLDRLNDWIVGASLYVPGKPECYIPMKHLVPIFETPYKNQLSYEEVAKEFQRFVDNKTKLIFANADFDLAMIYHSIKVDLIPSFYYDVILAWRALKENEKDNALKVLYTKYVLKGKADPKKFSDFFSPKLFPYCKPEVAKLYAANDAKITYDLFLWQLPFITPDNEKCKKNKLEKIANLIWNIEFPMVKACAMLHRRGVYLDDSISGTLHDRYTANQKKDEAELAQMVQELINEKDVISNRSRPFATGEDFNPNSGPHVKYLVNKLLGSAATSMDKDALKSIDKPVTNQILKVRGDVKLLGTYVDKMPRIVDSDHRVHSTYLSIGADTGRMASRDPNLQNVPSHALDIRHMFRATPEYSEMIQCTEEDGVVSVELSNFDKVIRFNNKLVQVSVLNIDDSVLFSCGDLLVEGIVTEKKTELGRSLLSMQIKDVQFTNSSVTILLKVTHPPYIMMSSDYSQQEPRLSAFITSDSKLINAFKQGRDAYATLVSTALGLPYEECLEFNPVTGELNPEGKSRRSIGKILNLGITYGMSVQSIAESLFSDKEDMTDEEKLKEAQKIQDSLMKGFPELAAGIIRAQKNATKYGYTETILGRRRHHPNMQLPRFEFQAMPGYVNPDIDPLDPESLKNKEQIPQRIVDALTKEFNSLKWYGKIVKRTKELAEQGIKVINNSYKIEEASRQCFNAQVQGSAADLTKMAILRLEHDQEWAEIGGRFVLPIHDELMCEVPLVNAEKGAEVLSRCMVEAGNFLPFEIRCDVESTYRWYGISIEDIAEREKPSNLNWETMSQSNIEWVQCMLCENEYLLPVFKEEDGSKPKGVRAKGVNGKITDELKQSVEDYKNRYNLHTDEEFIEHIEAKVVRGVY